MADRCAARCLARRGASDAHRACRVRPLGTVAGSALSRRPPAHLAPSSSRARAPNGVTLPLPLRSGRGNGRARARRTSAHRPDALVDAVEQLSKRQSRRQFSAARSRNRESQAARTPSHPFRRTSCKAPPAHPGRTPSSDRMMASMMGPSKLSPARCPRRGSRARYSTAQNLVYLRQEVIAHARQEPTVNHCVRMPGDHVRLVASIQHGGLRRCYAARRRPVARSA